MSPTPSPSVRSFLDRLRAPRRGRVVRRFALGLAMAGVVVSLGSCAAPQVRATTIVSGLENPWDVAFTPNGSMIWTEKGGRIMRRVATGTTVRMAADMSDLFVGSETGLMGLAIDPAFSSNHRMYTCQGWTDGSLRHIRVIPWVANGAGDLLVKQRPIITGIPVTTGRHGGCRLRFDTRGRLLVGTGDAAIGGAPQGRTSLGGKVLRVDRFTGQGVSDNPFFASPNAHTRRILSYGHRNVQGLAIRPADGTIWSAEHGPDRDDEVNRIVNANYGWHPVPGYNEAVPMTDRNRFPTAKPAAWSSGAPTVATSGAAWVAGPRWKGYDDTLVVATLKGQSLLVFDPQPNGSMQLIARLFHNQLGRLRSVTMGPDNNLYVTTADGSGDRIIRFRPS